ncbi:MAG: glycosyltransferase family 10 [Steroidobacteraceae bacterium]
MSLLRGRTLYIDPPSHHFLADRLFEDDSDRLNGDQQNAPYVALRERLQAIGMAVHTVDRLPRQESAEREFLISLGGLDRLAALSGRADLIRCAFFALECPIVEPGIYRRLPRVARDFRRVCSWSSSKSLHRFTNSDLQLERFRWPQSFDGVHESVWSNEDRRFLAMINANKLPRVYWQELYTERMRAVAYFESHGEIDLYGKGWGEPPVRVGRTWLPWTIKKPALAIARAWQRRFPGDLQRSAQRAWRGSVSSKALTLGQYRYALCFENCVIEGWITEKIFDCFFAGVVPVYWGAPEIADIVPAECYIDMRSFDGYAELREYLHGLSDKEWRAQRQAARDFLASPGYQPFTCKAFVERIVSMLHEDSKLLGQGAGERAGATCTEPA